MAQSDPAPGAKKIILFPRCFSAQHFWKRSQYVFPPRHKVAYARGQQLLTMRNRVISGVVLPAVALI